MRGAVRLRARATVLVVDDDHDVRDGLKLLLDDAGYSAVCVRNGSDALAWLRRHPAPAAILLDLFMPVMSGWELVRRLQASSQLMNIPVILVTGSEPHWGYPAARVLKKPLDPDEVLREVQAVHPLSPDPAS
jgi:CheY-like chemotaxis protein